MEKKNNILITILIIIGIVVITTGVVLVFGNSEDKNNKNNQNILYACDGDNGVNIIYSKNECSGEIIGQVNTETENPKVLDYALYYDKSLDGVNILVDDNGLKVYNTSNNKVIKLNLSNNYEKYSLGLFEKANSNIVNGVIYLNNGEIKYYNINTNKEFSLPNNTTTFDSSQTSEYLVVSVSRDDLSNSDMYDCSHDILYSAITGEKILSDTSNKCNTYIQIKKTDDNYFFVLRNGDYLYNNSIIYGNNKNKIIEVADDKGNYSITSNGFLYVYQDNKLFKYDTDGNSINLQNDYGKIYGLSDNYILVLDNNELVLVNLVNNEKNSITNWNNNYKVIDKLTFYRSDDDLINITDKNGNPREEGFYIVLEDNNIYTEYFYNPKTDKISKKIIGSAIPEESGICALDYEFAYCD